MNIKAQRDNKGRYFIRVYVSPGNRPYKLLEQEPGMSYQEAKKEAEKFVASLTVPAPVSGRPTLSQCFHIYLNSVSGLSEKNATLTRTLLEKKFLPFFTDKAVEDLTVLDIERYKTYRLNQKGYCGKNIQGGSINRELSILMSVFNKAFYIGITKTQPLMGKKVTRLPHNSNHGKYFERDEFQRFIQTFSDTDRVLKEIRKCCRIAGSEAEKTAYVFNASRAGEIFKAQLLTCSRISELLTLKWQAINFKTKTISIFMPKVRKKQINTKHQEMSEELLSMLERLYKESKNKAGYVFTRQDGQAFNIGQMERFFEMGMRLAGITEKHLTPHSLRHSACSWLVQSDVSIAKIQKIAAHSDIRSTLIYASLKTADLTSALQGLASESAFSVNAPTNAMPLKAVSNLVADS